MRAAVVTAAPRPLGSAPAADPGFEKALAAAEQAGYQRGVRDGSARERAAASGLAGAVEAAVGEAMVAARRLREEHAGLLLEAGVEVAELVLGHAVHDGGSALETRVRQALEEIEDEDLTLALNPEDAARLGGLAAGMPRLEVVADPGLEPGEARITGRWAQADLTHQAALEAVRRALR